MRVWCVTPCDLKLRLRMYRGSELSRTRKDPSGLPFSFISASSQFIGPQYQPHCRHTESTEHPWAQWERLLFPVSVKFHMLQTASVAEKRLYSSLSGGHGKPPEPFIFTADIFKCMRISYYLLYFRFQSRRKRKSEEMINVSICSQHSWAKFFHTKIQTAKLNASEARFL